MQEHLKSVHELLTESAQESRAEDAVPMKPYTFRADEDIRHEAEAIAERNGSSLPALFRAVMKQLVGDYKP